MAAIKTRIWQGGIAGITGAAAHPLEEQVRLEVSPPSALVSQETPLPLSAQTPPSDEADVATERAVVHSDAGVRTTSQSRTLPGLGERAREQPQPHAWWAARTERERAAHERMASTRIMPIEQLLGGGAAEALPSARVAPRSTRWASSESTDRREAGDDAADEVTDRPPGHSTSTVRMRIALLLMASGVAAFMCLVPAGSMAPAPTPAHASATTHERSRAAPPPAARASAVASSPAGLSPAVASAPVSDPMAPPASRMQRAAIDALVAGDYAGAERLYGELARSTPASPAFGEAARILAGRTRAR